LLLPVENENGGHVGGVRFHRLGNQTLKF